MNELLERALAALGKSPTHRELDLVAETLRSSGDGRALAAVTEAGTDEDAWKRLAAIAERAGSSGFAALDLTVVVTAGPGALVRDGEGRR